MSIFFLFVIIPFDAVFSQIPRLFAFIIGINEYQKHDDLKGAVPDGKAFVSYLMKRLCVPENQITTLFDHEATRTTIIEGFRKLRDNECINKGDPIFIFYAGHGSQKLANPDWVGGRDVQMEVILSYDCGAVDSEDPEEVEPIPDITIGNLIDEIAEKRGNNIVGAFLGLFRHIIFTYAFTQTVVFDSCHSASGTRGTAAELKIIEDDDPLTRVRFAQFKKDVPFRKDTDSEIRGLSRGACPVKGYSRRGLWSHMFISACKSNEEAKEYNGRGKLSTALLKLLDLDNGIAPNKLRYRDILTKMEPISESSVCFCHRYETSMLNDIIPPF